MDHNMIELEMSTRLYQGQWKGFFLNISVAKQDLGDYQINCEKLRSRTRIISVVEAHQSI